MCVWPCTCIVCRDNSRRSLLVFFMLLLVSSAVKRYPILNGSFALSPCDWYRCKASLGFTERIKSTKQERKEWEQEEMTEIAFAKNNRTQCACLSFGLASISRWCHWKPEIRMRKNISYVLRAKTFDVELTWHPLSRIDRHFVRIESALLKLDLSINCHWSQQPI